MRTAEKTPKRCLAAARFLNASVIVAAFAAKTDLVTAPRPNLLDSGESFSADLANAAMPQNDEYRFEVWPQATDCSGS